MSLQSAAIFSAVISHAQQLGVLESVADHEPKTPPISGITGAVSVQDLGPVPAGSGLAATTGLLVLSLRLFSNLNQEPQGDIDLGLLGAVDALFTAYSGDFDLGGLIRNVDLLGQTGERLRAVAGYVQFPDVVCRVMTITLPLIINDLWEQAP